MFVWELEKLDTSSHINGLDGAYPNNSLFPKFWYFFYDYIITSLFLKTMIK